MQEALRGHHFVEWVWKGSLKWCFVLLQHYEHAKCIEWGSVSCPHPFLVPFLQRHEAWFWVFASPVLSCRMGQGQICTCYWHWLWFVKTNCVDQTDGNLKGLGLLMQLFSFYLLISTHLLQYSYRSVNCSLIFVFLDFHLETFHWFTINIGIQIDIKSSNNSIKIRKIDANTSQQVLVLGKAFV